MDGGEAAGILTTPWNSPACLNDLDFDWSFASAQHGNHFESCTTFWNMQWMRKISAECVGRQAINRGGSGDFVIGEW